MKTAPRSHTATRTRTRAGTHTTFDSAFATEGLINARTRIVGTRTGLLADAIVGVVQLARSIGVAVRVILLRAASVVTGLGWALAGAVPVAFVAGYWFGWIELVTAAWAGLVLLALAALYLLNSTPLHVDLTLVTTRVAVGDDATGRIVVRSPLRAQLSGANVEIPLGAGLIDIALPALSRDATYLREFAIPTAHRAVVVVGPVRSVRADPIGLVRREQKWTAEAALFVHPQTIGLPSMSSGLVRDLEGNPTRELSTNDMSFHALREYQPGDERRSIHWKSTAKTGVHMVRQFEETRRSHLLVALSLATADFASEAEFELAVSVAASLGVRAIRDTRDVSVSVSEITPEFSPRKLFAVRSLPTLSRNRLLDALAGVDRSATALGILDVARVSSDQVVGVSVAFLVCGSPATPAQLRSAAAQFPPGVETVAIICDAEKTPGVRRLAGLTVFTIGYLDDLRSFLARSVAA